MRTLEVIFEDKQNTYGIRCNQESLEIAGVSKLGVFVARSRHIHVHVTPDVAVQLENEVGWGA